MYCKLSGTHIVSGKYSRNILVGTSELIRTNRVAARYDQVTWLVVCLICRFSYIRTFRAPTAPARSSGELESNRIGLEHKYCLPVLFELNESCGQYIVNAVPVKTQLFALLHQKLLI